MTHPLDIIHHDLALLAKSDYDAVQGWLTPPAPGETTIRVIEGAEPRAYFTLGARYFFMARKAADEAESQRYMSLSQLATDIGWFLAKIEIGGKEIWMKNLGIRTGFTVISRKIADEMNVQILSLGRITMQPLEDENKDKHGAN